MDDHFDIAHVFEIGKFDITRLTCIKNLSHVCEIGIESMSQGSPFGFMRRAE